MGERMEGEEKWEGTCCDVMSGTDEREARRKEEERREDSVVEGCPPRRGKKGEKKKRKEEWGIRSKEWGCPFYVLLLLLY
jgi:hypothetical protein